MMPFDRLEIPAEILEEMTAHARTALPNECCGLLAGTISDGIRTVRLHLPIGNQKASPKEYLTDARDMLHSYRTMRERGLVHLAIYHSHPSSAPLPSARDIADNTYGESVVHVIVSLAAEEPEVRAWWLGEGESRPAEWCCVHYPSTT
jgi:proteasome lid subunit RPN8/RPN11